MGWEVTCVWRVATGAVALLVGKVLDTVSGNRVAGKAELIGGRRKSDVGRVLDIGDRVAGGAAHGDGGVDVLPSGLVLVALKAFGSIDVGWKKNGMPVKVGARRRSEEQQDETDQECGEKNDAVARVRERHGSSSAESEDIEPPWGAEGQTYTNSGSAEVPPICLSCPDSARWRTSVHRPNSSPIDVETGPRGAEWR